MPERTTERSGNSAPRDRLPPLAPTLFRSVEAKDRSAFQTGNAILTYAENLGHSHLGEFTNLRISCNVISSAINRQHGPRPSCDSRNLPFGWASGSQIKRWYSHDAHRGFARSVARTSRVILKQSFLVDYRRSNVAQGAGSYLPPGALNVTGDYLSLAGLRETYMATFATQNVHAQRCNSTQEVLEVIINLMLLFS
jgi:hypothetical protein